MTRASKPSELRCRRAIGGDRACGPPSVMLGSLDRLETGGNGVFGSKTRRPGFEKLKDRALCFGAKIVPEQPWLRQPKSTRKRPKRWVLRRLFGLGLSWRFLR